jgi:hypothetical protein
MRAVVVTEYGGRAEAVEMPAPTVQAGQVLIKVLAARYVANADALTANGMSALNFQVPVSAELLERVANALVIDSIVQPPINRISLQRAPVVFAGENGSLLDGRTVIVV